MEHTQAHEDNEDAKTWEPIPWMPKGHRMFGTEWWRTCAYCGSAHPMDLYELAKQKIGKLVYLLPGYDGGCHFLFVTDSEGSKLLSGKLEFDHLVEVMYLTDFEEVTNLRVKFHPEGTVTLDYNV